MKPRKSGAKSLLFLGFLPSLISCGNSQQSMVKVLLEEGDFRCAKTSLTLPRGSDFTFELTLDISKVIDGASYKNYTLDETLENNVRYDTITFHHVNYSTLISLDIKEAVKITYRADDAAKEEYAVLNHERVNTSTDYRYFRKEGYCLTGWKNGETTIGLGSRVEAKENVELEAIYIPETPVSSFEFEAVDASRVYLKRFIGTEKVIAIPESVEGKNVIAIEEGAFSGLNLDELVLPPTLATIHEGAVTDCRIRRLVYFDSLTDVTDASFSGSAIGHIRINARSNPAYIRTYYGTYAEKLDRLAQLKDKEKIILYSGSSTRFGFDSELIDKTFPDKEVVNMGVFAYTPSYPQIEVISSFLNEGDLVIVSPEFDAIEEQIHLRPILDSSFFAMIEANYDILSYLDVSRYENFFSSYKEYQYNRSHLTRYSYADTPYRYDEDGNRMNAPSYNRYGDYVVYRPNNENRTTFGVKRAFYHKDHFPEEYLDCFLSCLSMLEKANVYYDYSPRMSISLSADSTSDSIAQLGAYFEQRLPMRFLSTIEESLMDPLYFYGTDNHLSTEGVAIRTQRVIASLTNNVNI